MLLIFSAFMLRYFGKTAGIIALIIFVVFAFPRVMIGAHWFTDIVVGSLTVILIGLPVADDPAQRPGDSALRIISRAEINKF